MKKEASPETQHGRGRNCTNTNGIGRRHKAALSRCAAMTLHRYSYIELQS
jgi:hypothetical protein